MPLIRARSGLSLIEVLVALVILATGLLSLASLELTALHSLRDARLRTRAQWLGTGFLAQWRADPEHVPRLDQWRSRVVAALPAGRVAASQLADRNRITLSWRGDDGRRTQITLEGPP